MCDDTEAKRFAPGERAEELWHRKRTRLLTNLASLRTLVMKCCGEHAREPLQGSVRTACGWRSRSELAAAYSRKLCRGWTAAVAKGIGVGRAEERWRRWIELYMAGDVELQPGPSVSMPRAGRTSWKTWNDKRARRRQCQCELSGLRCLHWADGGETRCQDCTGTRTVCRCVCRHCDWASRNPAWVMTQR